MAISISVLFLGCCLCFYFLVNVIKLLKQIWWTPIRIQSNLRSQGVKGPSYKLFHGNTKEITDMRNRIMNSPMELSHNMLHRILPHVYSWTVKYGPNYLNWYGTQAQLVITEPQLIHHVLTNKDGSYENKSVQGYVDKLFGDGLAACRGQKWLKMRKLANYAFHGESLKGMIPAMIESVESMLEKWRREEIVEIEVFSEFKVLTSEIISRAAFGSSYLEGKNFFYLLERMTIIVARNNYKVGIHRRFLKSSDDVESEELDRGLRESIIKMIKKREDGEQLTAYGNDFFGQLLKAYHDKKISIDDLIDECKTFYVAGHETTASSLTWTVLLLATHPLWQDKAREEAFRLFGKQNSTPDNIGRLKTLSMIINESLRLYTPVVNMTKEVQKQVRLGSLEVPAKITISLPVIAVHNNPQIWGPDVHCFKPERFTDGIASAGGFLPFGLGPRTCVGMNFATSEMKLVLAMIMQHYRFTLSPTYRHSPVHKLTVFPQYGVQIRLEAL